MSTVGPTQRAAAPSWSPGDAVPSGSDDLRRDHRTGRPVFAVGLAWLVFLTYPAIELSRSPLAPVRLLAATAGLACLVGLYTWLMWRVAFTERAPRLGVWVLIVLALAVPLAYGGMVWFGPMVYVAVVLGFALSPGRAALAVAALAVLAAVVALWLHPHWPVVLALPLLIALSGVVALTVNGLLRMNQQLAAARGEVRRLAAGEERLRLARELHDSVKQQVFVTAMEIGTARALTNRGAGGVAAHLAEADASIRGVQRDLAAVIDHLRPAALEGKDLGEALRQYATAWARRHGVEAELDLSAGASVCIPRSVSEPLFLATQEALVNAARHSDATRVHIGLSADGASLALTVADDGRGYVADEASLGHGLRGIRERMEELGGTMAVDTAPGYGTRVTCRCPLPGVAG